jgi:hypothetical protein
MGSLPSAIIFVNNDLTENVKSTLSRQLYIHEIMSGPEFDARVSLDPEYPNIVKLNGLRIMVIRDFWLPRDSFNLADVAIFVKSGLAYVEINNLGPPNLTLPVSNLNIHDLLRKNV